ncbi:MAG: chromosome partitioning protein ParB [Micavibrio aeruginosavorus]|uniref:Chromosome partitioning protein ParB n=1 Tax=Micavibrio aeruginosavorus TaxID=349221 RepID=A0A2W5PW74_9BACT|nr:MAG: chromosome partitioning protein ParB [Micavibrio aeruginosavorus]
MTPKQRGLGRGLDALFEDEEATFAVKEDAPMLMPQGPRRTLGIGQLTPNPDQPRTHFDPAHIGELAASIKQHGLLQPILVRPVPGNKDMYEIVAGERRWRAAQKAQLHEVPVTIRELDDSQVLQIALIENLVRQDLNPLEEARGYQRLMDEFAFTADDVGQSVSRSRSHVANMVRLLTLPESVQNMVVESKLSAGHARALINAENPALLAQEVVTKGLSVRQTEKLAAETAGREIQSRGKSSSAPAFKDPNILAFEKDLSNILGLKVTIAMDGETAGVLSVAFKDLDQLDEVALRLSKIPKVLS